MKIVKFNFFIPSAWKILGGLFWQKKKLKTTNSLVERKKNVCTFTVAKSVVHKFCVFVLKAVCDQM